MKNNFDEFTNSIAQPDVFLCHRNYDVICPLTQITDLKIYEAANSYDEITFSFNKISNGVEFENWDKLKSLKVVKVKNGDEEKYFEIAVDVSDEESTVKNITGISMESELAQISIGTLSINGETDRDKDSNWENNTYISTVVYKASDKNHSLLHRILSYAPHWKIGHVDNQITDSNTSQLVDTSNVVRTFEFSNTNVYDALQEVAKELDVVFTFDSKTRSVNMYDLNTIGEDTTVFVNKENLANSFTCSSNKDSIKNCFKVTGGDDLINSYVRSVNPNGSEYIYYVSKDQREDMSDELVAKLEAYDDLYESKKTEYENACVEMFAAIDDVQKYTNTLAPKRTDIDTTAIDEYNKLKSITSVYVQSKKNLLQRGVEKAILTLAQITVDYRYTVTIQDEDTYNESNSVWTGKFKVVNESNSEDVVVGTDDVTISILEDEKTSLQNQIDKLIGDGDFEDATVDELREKYINKEPEDYDYCQERLQEMWKVYAECANVLLEKGYAVKKDDNKFFALYTEYHEKEVILHQAYDKMTTYIKTLENKLEEKKKQVNAYHDELDFVKFLGDKLYKEFCCYRREDVYENSNYISDGLSDKEAIEKAKTLVEVATKELYKASLFQYTYTANLNNLFNNSVFKPFWGHFALFNWIRAEVDEIVISLRLIGITYDYANPDKIEVEFSEQVRNANGITDLESILNQAKSMATSYSSTAKQASQGAESYSDFKTLKEEGLNSALMNIKNSNNEEVTVDGRGINCRSRDINDDYDQCQLRITGKNIVMTDDDWNSARLAIGRGLFNGQEKYGVWCDILVGNIVASETLMISNGSKTFIVDKDGIIVNNMKLDMYSADKKHRLLIDPNLKSMFNIYNEDKQVFFIDANGNVTMKGNLCVENNGLYCNINMNSDNIIEVGYNNNNDNNDKLIENKWVRVGEGLNLTDLDYDYYRQYYLDNCFYDQNKCITKNGETYIIYKKKIKHWNIKKHTWEIIYDLNEVFKNQHENSFCFIDNMEEDSCLYIYNINKNNYDIKCIVKYNIDTSEEKYFFIDIDTGGTTYPKYLFYSNNTFYMYDTYHTYKISLTEDIEKCWGKNDVVIKIKKWEKSYNEREYIQDIVIYNNNVYLLYLSTNKLKLYKVTDLETQTMRLLSEMSIVTDQFLNISCNTCIVNNELYIIPITDNKLNKTVYIYDFQKNMITGSIPLPKSITYVEGSDPGNVYYVFPCRASLSFYDGESIHLFNTFKQPSKYINVNNKEYSYCGNTKDPKLSYLYLQHFVYHLNKNDILVDNKFLEKQNGVNFNISSQSSFAQIGDTIYSINSICNFYNVNEYNSYNTIIESLDTTKDDESWKTVCVLDAGIVPLKMVQSDSKECIYFLGTIKKTLKHTLYEVNIKNGTFVDLINKTEETKYSIVYSGGFGFYFSNEKKLIFCRASTVVVDIETNTQISTNSHIPFISNNIFYNDNKEVYSIAIENNTAYLCKLDLTNDAFIKLSKILDYADDNYGFSIAAYNGKIYIYYSLCGALSSDWYAYTIANSSLVKQNNMFYSEGLHISDKTGDYSTCYLPAIGVSKGIHYFCGNNKFDGLVGNGGYMHVVYSETNGNTDIANPLGNKLFYVTNNGNLSLYGDIYARSLTLGSDVSIDTSKITGLDDKLKDIKSDFNGVTDDLKNVVYKGDIVTTTEKLDNGVIKTTSRVPTGVDADGNVTYEDSVTYTSADGNYVMTDVGLGDKEKENGCYTIISKEGLLEAVNANISGTVYANAGKFGGWDIGTHGLKSELFDDASNTNGIRLDSNGEIRSKGSLYSSLDNDGSEGWFARLCSGKWIFGYYDSTQSDPFIPPKDTPYSDISVNGIYMCSKEAIQNQDTRYLFEVNTLNDTVNIANSSKTSPALTITNNYYDSVGGYDAPALVLHSPKQGYRNRPFDARLKVTGKLLGTDQTVNAQYSVALFGEEQLGRIIFRSNTFDTSSSPVGNTVSDTSSDPTVPAILGSDRFRWYQGYFMELYSKNGVNTSSDKKIKNHIGYMDTDKSLELVNDLKPVEYTLKDNANGRKHMGFYAQDVKDTANKLDLGNISLYSATWNKDGHECYYSDEAPDDELSWSLKYEEFIAPLVGSVQALTREVHTLKEEIKRLKGDNVR